MRAYSSSGIMGEESLASVSGESMSVEAYSRPAARTISRNGPVTGAASWALNMGDSGTVTVSALFGNMR